MPPDLSHYSQATKAAIVVQALMQEGEVPPLADLPEELQVVLTREIGRLKLVDRDTVDAVIEEFTNELESLGLAGPQGINATLTALSPHLSPAAAARLRAEAAGTFGSDPWQQVRSMRADELTAPLSRESIEICAVLLSRLPTDKAAECLSLLPGERARRIALAFSRATQVTPLALTRIGHAIVRDYYSVEAPVFETPPEKRVGAILNIARAQTRDQVLADLETDDPIFAERVRKSIFTYALIAKRLNPRDVPKLIKAIPPETLAQALAATLYEESVETDSSNFLLENIPQRLANSLREQAASLEVPRKAAREAVLQDVAQVIRGLVDNNEITLRLDSEEEVNA